MTDNVRILPSASTIPPFPIGGLKSMKDTERYLQQLSNALKADRGMVGDRVERRVLHGEAATRPTADGSGNLHYSTDTEELEIDTGTWTNLVTAGGVKDHGDLTGLDDPADHDWAVQTAGDIMTGDLIMDACEIYLGLGSLGLIGEYLADTYANIARIYSSTAIYFGDYNLAVNIYGSAARPYYLPDGGTADYLALLYDLYFLNLTDVDETDYTGHAGEPVIVNATANGLAFGAGSSGFVLRTGDTMTGPLVMDPNAYLSLKYAPAAAGVGAVNIGLGGSGLEVVTYYGDCSFGVTADMLAKFTFGTGVNGLHIMKPLVIEEGGAVQIWDGVGTKYTVLIDDGSPFTGVYFGNANLSCLLLGTDSRPYYNGNALALYTDVGAGVSYFTDLVDTPANYTGSHDYAVVVHPTNNELYFLDLDNKYVNKITGGTFSGEVTFAACGIVFLNDGSPYCDWLMEASDTTGALAIFDRSSGSTYPFAIDLGAANNTVRLGQFGAGIGKAPILTGELLQVDGGIDIANTEKLRGWNNGATLYDLIGMNSSNFIELGNAGIRTILLGLPTLPNNEWLYSRNYADTAYRDLIRMNTSSHVEVGDGTSGCYTYMKGDRVYFDNPLYLDDPNSGLYSTGTFINVYDDIKMQTCDIVLYPVGSSAIKAVDAGATERNLISLQSDNTIVGNDSGGMSLVADSSVKLPGVNTGGLAFEVSAASFSDGLKLSAGYFTVGMSARDLLLYCADYVDILGGDLRIYTQGDKILMKGTSVDLDLAYVDGSDNMVIGDESAASVWVIGDVLAFKGRKAYAVDPSTSNWPTSNTWGIHKNTSSGDLFLVANDGGTIKKVQLT